MRYSRAKARRLNSNHVKKAVADRCVGELALNIKVFMPEMLKQVRLHSGQQQLSLHGWSLGGALSLPQSIK
jgi:hypothetical protein